MLLEKLAYGFWFMVFSVWRRWRHTFCQKWRNEDWRFLQNFLCEDWRMKTSRKFDDWILKCEDSKIDSGWLTPWKVKIIRGEARGVRSKILYLSNYKSLFCKSKLLTSNTQIWKGWYESIYQGYGTLVIVKILRRLHSSVLHPPCLSIIPKT